MRSYWKLEWAGGEGKFPCKLKCELCDFILTIPLRPKGTTYEKFMKMIDRERYWHFKKSHAGALEQTRSKRMIRLSLFNTRYSVNHWL